MSWGYWGGTTVIYCGTLELNWIPAGYVCEGTGAQNITAIECECWSPTSDTAIIGIYAGTDLIVRTSAKAGPTSQGVVSWAAGDLTWEAGYSTLTGGSTYKLVYLPTTNNVVPYGTTGGSSGDSKYYTVASLPTTLPDGYSWTLVGFNIRVTTEAAATGQFARTAYYYAQQ